MHELFYERRDSGLALRMDFAARDWLQRAPMGFEILPALVLTLLLAAAGATRISLTTVLKLRLECPPLAPRVDAKLKVHLERNERRMWD